MKCLFIISALLLVPTSAHALGHCKDAESAAAHLGKAYQEASVAQGVNAAGALVQVWSTKDGKTWTITIRIPRGPVCLMAQGTDWQAVPWALPGAGA